MNSKNTLRTPIILTQLFLLVSLFAFAQEGLQLADIYKNGTYSSKGYGPVRWMEDNKSYSTLEDNKEFGGVDIIRYEAKSGKDPYWFQLKN